MNNAVIHITKTRMLRIGYGLIIASAIIAAGLYTQRRSAYQTDQKQVVRCEKEPEKNGKKQCWEKLVRDVLKSDGINSAFTLIAELYTRDPDFAEPCHAYTHIIGQAAYSQFRSTKHVEITDKTAYCAFGFYHGFMETLVARKGDISEAKDFCRYVDTTIGQTIPNAKYGCYHGIGHGSTDVHNPKYFGNERALIASALEKCEAFAQDAHQLTICATGIFDSISIAYYSNGLNGLVMNKQDPLWLCREQPSKYKEACYRDMMPAVLWLGDYDLASSLRIVFKHAEEQYKVLSVHVLAENSIRFLIHKAGAETAIPVCRALPQPYGQECLAGAASGVMQFGTPGTEYTDALSFCQKSDLTTDEMDTCMKEVLTYTKERYSKKLVNTICGGVESVYRKYCRI